MAVDAAGASAVNRRLERSMSCPYQVFVDGVKLPFPAKLDSDLPSPKEIFGIEVYSSAGTIPLQYKTTSGGGFCGVILVWTRSGA